MESLYEKRDNLTGLFANEIHVRTGEWLSLQCGLGAGLDSYYEYLLKVDKDKRKENKKQLNFTV